MFANYFTARPSFRVAILTIVMSVAQTVCAVDRTSELRKVVVSDQPISPELPFSSMGHQAREVINASGHVAFMSSYRNRIYLSTELDGQLTTLRTNASGIGDLYALDDDTVVLGANLGNIRPKPQWFTGDQMSALPTAENAVLTAVHPSGDYVVDTRDTLMAGSVGETPVLVRRAGQIAPGTPEQSRFIETTSFTLPRINGNGNVVFANELQGAALSDNNRTGIWRTQAGELSLLYREGDLLPNSENGERFTGFVRGGQNGGPKINDNDDVAFVSGMTSDVNGGHGVIFAHRNGTLDQVVLTGTPAPGTAGRSFGSMTLTDVAINNEGQVAFRTFVDREPAMFVEHPNGEIDLLAIRGQSVPGVPSPLLLDRHEPFQFNARGQVAFSSEFRFENEVRIGAFASTPDGELQTIAMPGDTVEVTFGDERVIRNARINAHNSGNADGLPSVMNDAGEVVVALSFTDGTSGLFVSNLVREPIAPGLPGDFNGDLVLDASDIDLLAKAIRDQAFSASLDLDQDGVLNLSDHRFWINELKQTNYGDANLDGIFDSGDLVTVFRSGLYERDNLAAGWGSGDWNGDGFFDSSDLVLAFSTGAYQTAAVPVPEPVPACVLLAATVAWFSRRKQTTISK